MPTLRQILEGKTMIQAYGTSEGVTKEWDTRGRSGKNSNQSFEKFLDEVNKHTLRITGRPQKEVDGMGGNAHDIHQNGNMNLEQYYKNGEPAESVARKIISQQL